MSCGGRRKGQGGDDHGGDQGAEGRREDGSLRNKDYDIKNALSLSLV